MDDPADPGHSNSRASQSQNERRGSCFAEISHHCTAGARCTDRWLVLGFCVQSSRKYRGKFGDDCPASAGYRWLSLATEELGLAVGDLGGFRRYRSFNSLFGRSWLGVCSISPSKCPIVSYLSSAFNIRRRLDLPVLVSPFPLCSSQHRPRTTGNGGSRS